MAARWEAASAFPLWGCIRISNPKAPFSCSGSFPWLSFPYASRAPVCIFCKWESASEPCLSHCWCCVAFICLRSDFSPCEAGSVSGVNGFLEKGCVFGLSVLHLTPIPSTHGRAQGIICIDNSETFHCLFIKKLCTMSSLSIFVPIHSYGRDPEHKVLVPIPVSDIPWFSVTLCL